MTRVPASNEVDVHLVTDPAAGVPPHAPVLVHALVKVTWRTSTGVLERAEAEPLTGPLDASTSTLPVGSDYWVDKPLADVVVLGEACAPGGRAVEEMVVSCQVGERLKRIAVRGRRFIEWRGDRAQIGAPDPFFRVPLHHRHAYGGTDTRVPLPPSTSVLEALAAFADHPGAYPRNPRGLGYYVMPARFDGIELPRLENPDDPLTDERLIVTNPQRWYRQPLPWHLGWQEPGMFPRTLFCGVDACLPAPPSELPEVRLGLVPPDYKRHLLRAAEEPGAEPPSEAERISFARRFFQEASVGMSFADLAEGCPIVLTGMHPERHRVELELPPPPAVEVLGGGSRHMAELRIINVVLRPGEDRVAITYAARVAELPWYWRLGGHGGEVALRVEGAPVVELPPPSPQPPPPSGAEGATLPWWRR